MKKPSPKTKKYYDYHEVIDYIEKKYNIKVDGYTPKVPPSGEKDTYLSFWHWICDTHEVHNGSDIYLDMKWTIEHDSESWAPSWVKEILQMIMDEFGSNIELNVSW